MNQSQQEYSHNNGAQRHADQKMKANWKAAQLRKKDKSDSSFESSNSDMGITQLHEDIEAMKSSRRFQMWNTPPDQMPVQKKDDIGGTGNHGGSSKPNNTGLPDKLKTGVENLSGYSMDDVKVHYNSDKPAQLQAHAYAQGTDIHVASGQEKHLPHEAWHVVQQKQGRVKPTKQMKGKVNVNDDPALERQADIMGQRANEFTSSPTNSELQQRSTWAPVSQLVGLEKLSEPKVHQLPQEQFDLQNRLMNYLSDKIENTKNDVKDTPFRIGSVELSWPELKPTFGKPLDDIPAGLQDGYDLVKDDNDLKGAIISTLIKTLEQAGQIEYFTKNPSIGKDNRILVEIDFYYERPKNAVGFHKDSIGKSLFVNLNFNNKEEIPGPEFVLNPPVVDEHDEHTAAKLPDVFKADLASERDRLPLADEIKATKVPPGGVVSFVDEMIHHTTPYLQHRAYGANISSDDLKQQMLDEKIIDVDYIVAYRLTNLLKEEGTKEVTKQQIIDMGFVEDSAKFITQTKDKTTVNEMNAYLTSNSIYQGMQEKMGEYGEGKKAYQFIDKLKSSAPDAPHDKAALLATGLSEKEANFILQGAESKTTAEIEKKLGGEALYQEMQNKHALIVGQKQVMDLIESGRLDIKRDELAATGLPRPKVEEVFANAGRHQLDTVALAHCEDTCKKDTETKRYPLSAHPLKRQMSGLLDEGKVPQPQDATYKRQFFRTWVQTIPK
ncbi:eCIS core domain-containing protein [Aureibacter tunicatorum]|uniref:eCIS core domain-containing protein n=1 Tax=Aureibacter tunicatorum TaxID=866807 RepID=A0AAE3XRC9_9BACT|nr:DUF4157 domain-containing protein [Aureibacter tunicatorum]MDR6240034.1 hypothetical protein [Aureibacter tunicatorum]BDD04506.1 hypothetical protein AUTU_19890 [Aureibacter tunicatorum]